MGLLNWWRRRRRDKARLLLVYWDGRQKRRADPFRLWRQLATIDGQPITAMAAFVDQGKEPETTQFITAIAAAFGVDRWDEARQSGLTDWEVLNLLADLDEYLSIIKKKHSPGPTSPPPTA